MDLALRKKIMVKACSYDSFVDKLKTVNCRWENRPDNFDADLKEIYGRMKNTWKYSFIYKVRTDNSTAKALRTIEALAEKALEVFELSS